MLAVDKNVEAERRRMKITQCEIVWWHDRACSRPLSKLSIWQWVLVCQVFVVFTWTWKMSIRFVLYVSLDVVEINSISIWKCSHSRKNFHPQSMVYSVGHPFLLSSKHLYLDGSKPLSAYYGGLLLQYKEQGRDEVTTLCLAIFKM